MKLLTFVGFFVWLSLLAIEAACFTIGWNFVIVALFYAAPISFWQSLVAWICGRFCYRRFTAKSC